MAESCPMTPKKEFERQLAMLRTVKTIAVVGMSPNPDRPSHEVGLFLRDHGYTVIPIHPSAKEIAGLPVHPTLSAACKAPGGIDLADLFISGDKVPPVIEEASRLGIKRVWFQPGAEHPEAEKRARELGLETVSSACTMAVLRRAG